MTEEIGTIELLQQRIYPLDASVQGGAEVVVEPGRYKIYRDGTSTYWMMEGRINIGRLHRMGDGMFIMGSADHAGGINCVFPSRIYGQDEWTHFVNEDPVTQSGPDQRMKITLEAELAHD